MDISEKIFLSGILISIIDDAGVRDIPDPDFDDMDGYCTILREMLTDEQTEALQKKLKKARIEVEAMELIFHSNP